MARTIPKAKSKFYLSEINSATSKKSLFATCNKLLGLENLTPFTNIYLTDQLPVIIFIYKAKLIRTSIDQHKLLIHNSTTQTSLTIFSSFHPVTITQLHTMIKAPNLPSALWTQYQRLFCSNVLMTFCKHSPISLARQYCLINFRLI